MLYIVYICIYIFLLFFFMGLVYMLVFFFIVLVFIFFIGGLSVEFKEFKLDDFK